MGVNTLIQIGNSDNRLTQAEWARFVMELRDLFQRGGIQIHGEWYAKPDVPWQNANWSVEILPPTWWRSAVQRAGQPIPPGVYPNPENSPSAVHMRDREMAKARDQLKDAVKRLCYRWRQDSFAWTTAPVEIVETGYPVPTWTHNDDGTMTFQREAQARELASLKGWLPPGKTHLNDEDRKNLLHGGPPPEMVDAMKRLRQELDEAQKERLLSTLGPEPASDQQQPASTGVLAPCTDERCLLSHDVDVRLVFNGCVMSSPDNRAQAKIEQWGDLKPAWREGLGLPPLLPGESSNLAEAIAIVDEKLTTPQVIEPLEATGNAEADH